MSKTYNPYDNVLKVVSEAAGILGYSDSDIEALKYPERELKVAIPVRMMMEHEGIRRLYPTLHFPRTCQRRNPLPSGCQSG